jgi:hypothetical protein
MTAPLTRTRTPAVLTVLVVGLFAVTGCGAPSTGTQVAGSATPSTTSTPSNPSPGSSPSSDETTTSPAETKRRLARCLKLTAHYAKHPHDDWRPTAAVFVASCHEVPPPVLLGDIAPESVYGLTSNDVFFSLRFGDLARLADASCDCQAFFSGMGHFSCGLLAYGYPYSTVLRYNGAGSELFDARADAMAAVTAYCPEWLGAVPASDLTRARQSLGVHIVQGVDVPDPTAVLTALVHSTYSDIEASEEALGYVSDQTCLALGERAAGDPRNFALAQGFNAGQAFTVTLASVSIECPEFVPELKRQIRRISAENA